MNILITGGAGFIGLHVARRLALRADTRVTLVDNFFRGRADTALRALLADHANVQLVEGDLTEAKTAQRLGGGYDRVYHLAGINGTRYFYEVPHLVLRTNILSTIHVLDWFLGQAGREAKILLASSSETYAGTARIDRQFPIPTPETVPLCIEDVSNPRWSYAGSKLANELLLINYARTYHFRMSIVRYHNVYGPRMGYDHVIPELLRRVHTRETPFRIFGGKEVRAFCFIDDAVRATEAVMETREADGEIVNIGDDAQEIGIEQLARLIFDVTGFHPDVDIQPAPAGSVARRCPDLTKLRRLTGYARQIPLEDGLRRTWAWCQQDLDTLAATGRQ